jgi:hypothetical protein
MEYPNTIINSLQMLPKVVNTRPKKEENLTTNNKNLHIKERNMEDNLTADPNLKHLIKRKTIL